MDCDCVVTTTGGVALVAVRLRNPTPVARRVRVQNRLAGPVLPPRTAGVPEAGWDRDGVSVVVDPHETRPLGYACPLDTAGEDTPADPPAAVVSDERATAGEPARPDADHETTVRAVVRDLGRPAPPRDAVPPVDADTAPARLDTDTLDAESTDTDSAHPDDTDSNDTDPDDTADPPDDALPPAVRTWLAGVERRVEAAERLDADTPVSAATGAVEDLDCSPTALPARLASDSRRLDALADRLDRLAARAESASVPTGPLRSLS
jgi:hypothetical protein